MTIQRWIQTLGGAVILAFLMTLSNGAAIAQEGDQDKYPITIFVDACEEPPRLNLETPCIPVVGAMFEVTTESGEVLDSCMTDEATFAGAPTAVCSVRVPFDTTVLIFEDETTIPEGYAPVTNPERYDVPPRQTDPSVVLFHNVLQADGGDTATLVAALLAELTDILRDIY